MRVTLIAVLILASVVPSGCIRRMNDNESKEFIRQKYNMPEDTEILTQAEFKASVEREYEQKMGVRRWEATE